MLSGTAIIALEFGFSFQRTALDEVFAIEDPVQCRKIQDDGQISHIIN